MSMLLSMGRVANRSSTNFNLSSSLRLSTSRFNHRPTFVRSSFLPPSSRSPFSSATPPPSPASTSRPPSSSLASPSSPESPSKRPLHEDIYTIPNLLTISRIAACPVLAYSIVQGDFVTATAILAYAGVTDWVDGFIARKYNMGSVAGTVLDPLADKILMTTLACSLAYEGLLPLPLAILILGRDVALTLGAFYLRYTTLSPPKTWSRYWDLASPTVEFHPNTISKLNTFLQLLLMGSTTIAPLITGVDTSTMLLGLQCTVGATTAMSGLSYVFSKSAVKVLKP
ncbi:CDP-alcohol phosphatidyltransferase-domain-containing protein [Mrakia frigida]|uniref:cardiolipin synthase n=1 Tax=Mrakia frigida TaxID=29902 RepID=UPI003FCC0A12